MLQKIEAKEENLKEKKAEHSEKPTFLNGKMATAEHTEAGCWLLWLTPLLESGLLPGF